MYCQHLTQIFFTEVCMRPQNPSPGLHGHHVCDVQLTRTHTHTKLVIEARMR